MTPLKAPSWSTVTLWGQNFPMSILCDGHYSPHHQVTEELGTAETEQHEFKSQPKLCAPRESPPHSGLHCVH